MVGLQLGRHQIFASTKLKNIRPPEGTTRVYFLVGTK